VCVCVSRGCDRGDRLFKAACTPSMHVALKSLRALDASGPGICVCVRALGSVCKREREKASVRGGVRGMQMLVYSRMNLDSHDVTSDVASSVSRFLSVYRESVFTCVCVKAAALIPIVCVCVCERERESVCVCQGDRIEVTLMMQGAFKSLRVLVARAPVISVCV